MSERCLGTSWEGILSDTGMKSQGSGEGAEPGRGGVNRGHWWRGGARVGGREVPGHPRLSLPPPSEPCPARAAQDTELEEQTRTGEPRVWPSAQKQAAGAWKGPGPRSHQDTDNNTSARQALPPGSLWSAQHHVPRAPLPGPLPWPQFKNCKPFFWLYFSRCHLSPSGVE